MIFINWKRKIWRVLEVYKWAWRVCFPIWASFTIAAALTYADKLYLIALISFLLSIIFLIVAIITVTYHIKDARKKDYKQKHPPHFDVG
jgi:uncharacterized membrane protein